MDSPGVGVSVEGKASVGERRLAKLGLRWKIRSRSGIHSCWSLPSKGELIAQRMLLGGVQADPVPFSLKGRPCLDVVVELNPLFLHLVALSH